MDDTLVWASDWIELKSRCAIFLKNCRAAGVTVSVRKFECGPKLSFAGYLVSDVGIRPDPKLLAAITMFPTPKGVPEVRSILGLANQLASFMPDLAQLTRKMRELLKKSSAWIWLDDHQTELERLKQVLTSELLVQPFDPDLPVELLTDAARLYGLGFALLQREPSGRPRLIMCGSCGLTDTQKRYATVKLECLAIQWAIKKCDYYLQGLPSFSVMTDHRPLVGVLNKSLHEVDNLRLVRMREKLAVYSFKVIWVKGKTHFIADACFRPTTIRGSNHASILLFASFGGRSEPGTFGCSGRRGLSLDCLRLPVSCEGRRLGAGQFCSAVCETVGPVVCIAYTWPKSFGYGWIAHNSAAGRA